MAGLADPTCSLTRVDNRHSRAPWTSDTVIIDGATKDVRWAGSLNSDSTRITQLLASEAGSHFMYQAAIGENGKAKVSVLALDQDSGAVAYGLEAGKVFSYGCETSDVPRPSVDDFARGEKVFRALMQSPGYKDAVSGVTGGLFDPVAEIRKTSPKTGLLNTP